MSTIEIYMVHNDQDQEWGGPWTDYFDAEDYAREQAIILKEPFAVIALEFEYSDSELAWTTNGSDTWPPEKGQS